MEELISTYGYPAIVIGTFLEGETILVVAGYLASRGYLALPWVASCAFLGSWAGDTLYFFIGRRWGGQLLQRFPARRPAAERALRLLHRHYVVFILIFRFIYGLRTVSPFAIGLSGVPATRFVFLNMGASAIWAILFAVGGYLLGTLLEAMLKKAEQIEAVVIGGLVLVGFVCWLVHAFVLRHRQRRRAAIPAHDRSRARQPERRDDAG